MTTMPQRRWLTVPEIFEYSSNIGSARMAMEAGTDRQRDFLGRLGLLTAPSFELPEIGAPLVPSPWRPINTMTIAFGHGMSVSPLQMATAVSAVVNGGILHRATLIKRTAGEPTSGHAGALGAAPRDEMRKLHAPRRRARHGQARQRAGLPRRRQDRHGRESGGRALREARPALLLLAAFPITDPRYWS